MKNTFFISSDDESSNILLPAVLLVLIHDTGHESHLEEWNHVCHFISFPEQEETCGMKYKGHDMS